MNLSNLPPGVTDSMIPGNRPEDEMNERFWDELDAKFKAEQPELNEIIDALFTQDDVDDALVVFVEMARGMGYDRGYADGRGEYALEQAMLEQEADERNPWLERIEAILRADSRESTEAPERALRYESAEVPERAKCVEGTSEVERAVPAESTTSSERAIQTESAVATERATLYESTESGER